MKHVVQFSGGAGSWAAAKRVAAKHGTRDMVLLFCDTLIEDADLYRFLDDAAQNVGAPLVKVADGRTPFQVYRDTRFLGNSQVAKCSGLLKMKVADKWNSENCDPADTIIYIGIDWSESHRFDGAHGRGFKNRMAAQGWQCQAPLIDPPYLTKNDILADMRAQGLRPPRMYEQGFSHNNCSGRCCKAGQGHWSQMLKMRPDDYAQSEREEQELRALLGDVSMLTDRSGDGKKKVLTLATLRERLTAGHQADMYEIGGCGCFTVEE